MNVDTGQFAALTELAEQAEAARRTADAVMQHIGALYGVAYEHGRADGLEEASGAPPRRGGHLRAVP